MNHARPEKMKSNNLNLNFRKSNNKNKNGRDYGAVDPRGIGSITCAVPAGTGRNPPSPPDSPCPATCGVIRSNSLAFNKTLSPVSAVYSHSITQRAHTHTFAREVSWPSLNGVGGRRGRDRRGPGGRDRFHSSHSTGFLSLSLSSLPKREKRFHITRTCGSCCYNGTKLFFSHFSFLKICISR